MRAIAVVLLICLSIGALFGAPIPKKLRAKSLEQQILGSWKLTGKQMNYKFIIEYKPDGELEFRREYNLRTSVSLGTYRVEQPNPTYPLGSITWSVDEGGGRERGETSKITSLTETQLTIVDPEGMIEEFERE